MPPRRMVSNVVARSAACLLATALAIALSGCGDSPNAPRPGASRTWQMGFAGIPPRPDFLQAIAAINMWSTRADAALISYEPPWDSLLAGVSPESLITRDQLALVQFYRSKGFRLVVMLDPGNGLDRAGESAALVAAGRSIAEPAIRQLYRRYVVVVDSLLRPNELGVVLETNLIRAIAPAPLYQAIRQAAIDAAADVRARDASVRLMVSVQVETAWGRLPFTGVYAGVEQDFTDFPFVQTLGLSSYPYFASFARPEDIPLDYYSRLTLGHAAPVMVTEGGWTSESITGVVTSTPAIQRSYLVHQARLLTQARATASFQLTFTDLDLVVWPPGIAPFAYLGLVDADLVPKSALSAWDSIFALPRTPY